MLEVRKSLFAKASCLFVVIRYNVLSHPHAHTLYIYIYIHIFCKQVSVGDVCQLDNCFGLQWLHR